MLRAAIFVLLTLALTSLGGPPHDAGTTVDPDAGITIVECIPSKEDDWPDVGDGCHIGWEERLSDGSWVNATARVKCDRSAIVCGEEVWCRCPSPVRPRR